MLRFKLRAPLVLIAILSAVLSVVTLKYLRNLSLQNAAGSDASITHLLDTTTLESASLTDSRVSKAARERLDQCGIAIDDLTPPELTGPYADWVIVYRHHPGIIPDMDARNQDNKLVEAKMRQHKICSMTSGGLGSGYETSISKDDLRAWWRLVDDLKAGGTLTHYSTPGLDEHGFGIYPEPKPIANLSVREARPQY